VELAPPRSAGWSLEGGAPRRRDAGSDHRVLVWDMRSRARRTRPSSNVMRGQLSVVGSQLSGGQVFSISAFQRFSVFLCASCGNPPPGGRSSATPWRQVRLPSCGLRDLVCEMRSRARGTRPSRADGGCGMRARGTRPSRADGGCGMRARGTRPSRADGGCGMRARGTRPSRADGGCGMRARGTRPSSNAMGDVPTRPGCRRRF